MADQVELAAIAVAKLDIKPGQVLAIVGPDDWTPNQIEAFGEFLRVLDPLQGVKILMLPRCELAVVTPPEGFGT